jgi:hypothetical protein
MDTASCGNFLDSMTSQLWKKDWAKTRAHHESWWRREGLVVAAWGNGLTKNGAPHAVVEKPAPPSSWEQWHRDSGYVARRIRHDMAHRVWPADMLPVCWPDIGTVTLATYFGAIPEYADNNIWYHPCITDTRDVPPLVFDPNAEHHRLVEAVAQETVAVSEGNYLVGMPALTGGLDVLAELRGTQELLMDMVDNPDWVHEKLREIQRAYAPTYDRMYEIVRHADGGMAFGYFMLWAKGKVGLCQCDLAAMFSAEMFGEFVIPYLREQCRHLDYSMFHVDGSQCLQHLDWLLAVEELDAIQFTPEPKVPKGGDPRWHDIYRRILSAGKSVWVTRVKKHEVAPLLDAIGGNGVYMSIDDPTEADLEDLARRVEPYR